MDWAIGKFKPPLTYHCVPVLLQSFIAIYGLCFRARHRSHYACSFVARRLGNGVTHTIRALTVRHDGKVFLGSFLGRHRLSLACFADQREVKVTAISRFIFVFVKLQVKKKCHIAFFLSLFRRAFLPSSPSTLSRKSHQHLSTTRSRKTARKTQTLTPPTRTQLPYKLQWVHCHQIIVDNTRAYLRWQHAYIAS